MTDPSPLVDENAFGILVEYFNLEDDEYAESGAPHFVERFQLFEKLVLARVAQAPPAEPMRVVALGHALYLEFEEDTRQLTPIPWLKELRTQLLEHAFESAVVLAHGGRWCEEASERPSGAPDPVAVERVGYPSEPLRRSLLAAAACRGIDEGSGWGPGLYVDTEATEALKLKPKNEPTRLSVGGADFYRLGN